MPGLDVDTHQLAVALLLNGIDLGLADLRIHVPRQRQSGSLVRATLCTGCTVAPHRKGWQTRGR